MKLSNIYDLLNTNSDLEGIFKFTMSEIYDSLQLKLNQHLNDNESNTINKRHLIALGLLYTHSNNISKVKILFDLFKDDSEAFSKSQILDEFLMSMFIISSYALVSARKKVSQNYPNIKALTKDELIKALSVSELKDSQNLLSKFNSTFFEGKETYTWDEFKEKFDGSGGFGWILSSKGIRNKLEENNV